MLNKSALKIKRGIVKNLPIIILILILGTYLSIKAIPENSWDGFSFGSAQAMLSIKQWAKEGIFKNYALYIPQGYSKVVRYFDDLPLRQHAQGTQAGGLIGQRMYYTHYPSGAYIPPTILMIAGIENRFWLRFLEIIFSLSGLVLLYCFLTMVYNRTGAFWGTLFFGISIMFWNYADTLTDPPLALLFCLLIVTLSTWLTKLALHKESILPISSQKKSFWENNKKNFLNYTIWILYFALALTSYDFTFFIFAWLVGTDLIIHRVFNWKKWFLWAMAPTLAFGLQIFQNATYLGWHDMLLDFYGVYNIRVLGAGQGFWAQIFRLTNPFDQFFGTRYHLGILAAIIGFTYAYRIIKDNIFLKKYLILSVISTSFNFFLFPPTMFYQGRLISIFGGLLIAIVILETVKILLNRKELTKNAKFLYIMAFVIILGLWAIQIQRSYAYYKHNYANNIPIKNVEYDKKIKNLTPGDKIIMQIISLSHELLPSNPNPPYTRPLTKIAFRLYDNHINIPGIDPYPTVWPQDEYYVGSPILGFVRTSDLIRDLSYLKKRSEFSFSAIILSDQKEILEKLRNDIIASKISKTNLKIIELERDKFAMVIPTK